ncbi:uncharacterized protein LOC106180029 [Lingula anatina]|uniref:Uncharacterized protein LOC106180029 n=1 Tax=Lingula anatina TaxID=7574 RepID=A0A1S3KAR1_LINAN|nr:uncharacterized protein LOC106180029 [Lingula anatina]|eukprot:XP_013419346.1 uncharacterized protein LOC106180029 [Lingula anatina]
MADSSFLYLWLLSGVVSVAGPLCSGRTGKLSLTSIQNVEFCGSASTLAGAAEITMDIIKGGSSEVVSTIEVGQSIQVRLTLLKNTAHQGLRVTKCAAHESVKKFRTVTLTADNGCGLDGLVPSDAGFIAVPSTSERFITLSPPFQSFKFSGSDNVYFECRYLTCASSRPGNACELPHCQTTEDTEPSITPSRQPKGRDSGRTIDHRKQSHVSKAKGSERSVDHAELMSKKTRKVQAKCALTTLKPPNVVFGLPSSPRHNARSIDWISAFADQFVALATTQGPNTTGKLFF